MRCPYCGELEDKVVDSREAEAGGAIRRRRECISCARRFTTYERVGEMPLIVTKRSGAREPFESAKIISGIEKAVKNRPIPAADVVSFASEIEEELRAAGPEVTSEQVGRLVLERLRRLDEVAYLRFASVYKGFDDASDFAREAGELKKTTAPKQPTNH